MNHIIYETLLGTMDRRVSIIATMNTRPNPAKMSMRVPGAHDFVSIIQVDVQVDKVVGLNRDQVREHVLEAVQKAYQADWAFTSSAVHQDYDSYLTIRCNGVLK